MTVDCGFFQELNIGSKSRSISRLRKNGTSPELVQEFGPDEALLRQKFSNQMHELFPIVGEHVDFTKVDLQYHRPIFEIATQIKIFTLSHFKNHFVCF